MTDASASTPLAVVLAAGKGTRMDSERPKVLHPAYGRSLLRWVLDACRDAGCRRIFVVVGHGAEAIRDEVVDDDIEWVEQRQQLGTGHALAQVEPHLGGESRLLVAYGDTPLLRGATLQALLGAMDTFWGAMAVARVDDPGRLGRVRVATSGCLERSVEAADATPEELRIDCVNAGFYALPAPQIFDYLRRVRRDNAQGEVYLPEALNLAAGEGRRVACMQVDPEEALGVNNPQELERAEKALQRREDPR